MTHPDTSTASVQSLLAERDEAIARADAAERREADLMANNQEERETLIRHNAAHREQVVKLTARADAAEAELAAIRAIPAVRIAVKPLEWVDDVRGGFYCAVPIGHGFSCYYQITQDPYDLATVEFGIHCHGSGAKDIWKGPTANAKASAQADYEARILATLDEN